MRDGSSIAYHHMVLIAQCGRNMLRWRLGQCAAIATCKAWSPAKTHQSPWPPLLAIFPPRFQTGGDSVGVEGIQRNMHPHDCGLPCTTTAQNGGDKWNRWAFSCGFCGWLCSSHRIESANCAVRVAHWPGRFGDTN